MTTGQDDAVSRLRQEVLNRLSIDTAPEWTEYCADLLDKYAAAHTQVAVDEARDYKALAEARNQGLMRLQEEIARLKQDTQAAVERLEAERAQLTLDWVGETNDLRAEIERLKKETQAAVEREREAIREIVRSFQHGNSQAVILTKLIDAAIRQRASGGMLPSGVPLPTGLRYCAAPSCSALVGGSTTHCPRHQRASGEPE